VGQGTGLYWRYESSLKRSENQLGSVLVGCGSLLIVRRAQLHQPLDPRMANDLEIPVRIGAQGKAILYDAEIIGAEKPHTHAEEELQRTSRIVARGMHGFTMLFPEFLKSPLRLWQFLSHKFLRWFTLPLGILLFISTQTLNLGGQRKAFIPCGKKDTHHRLKSLIHFMPKGKYFS
jgi:biofilm PGA synthesis N-glycosyltransferase PgaC